MSKFSKPIKKTDEGVKTLLSEVFDQEIDDFPTVDSFYFFNKNYVFFQFIKTTLPFSDFVFSDFEKDFFVLTQFVKKAKGTLIVVFYTKEKEMFFYVKIIFDNEGKELIAKSTIDFKTFQKRFQELNKNTLK